MRILILGINFSPELTGIGKYTGEMARFLAQRGQQIRVVTAPPYYPHWRISAGYNPWLFQREDVQGVHIIRCPLWVPRKPRSFNRLLHLASFAFSCLPAMLSQIAWRPDLVFCIAPAIASAPAAWLTARIAGCKAWLHIQDFELDAAISLGMLPGFHLIGRLLGWIERALLNRFDHVSTISNRMLTHLRKKDLPDKKISLLANWVDCDLIYPTNRSTSLRQEWSIPDDAVLILYAGNLGQKQGLEVLLECARQYQDKHQVQFVLCGDGAARRTLLQQASGLSNVHFYSLVPVNRLNELLNTADVHVLPQRLNAADLVMPSKLSGMLASGRPVIGTALPGTELAEVIQQVGILIPPENPTALAEAIQGLVECEERRQELGLRGRQYALTHWEMNKVLNGLIHEVELLSL